MKKTLAALGLTMICQFAAAGPIVEIYECELNEDKTLADLSEMMATFTQYLREAGLEDSYTAHAGFQRYGYTYRCIRSGHVAPWTV